MSTPLHRRERAALCDTALALGPDAPTLCGGWDARDLVAHLLVRERPGLGAAGIAVPFLAGYTEKAMARTAEAPYEQMVEDLREPGLTPFRLPGVERLANTLEYFVHHEDLRRGQADWAPRSLPVADEETLWSLFTRTARLTARRLDVPVEAHTALWADLPPARTTIRGGDDPVVVSGRPSELVLFFYGRTEVHEVSVEGDDAAVARLRATDLGL